ncbi:MAG: DUF885 domain-containing protein [Bacteroidales bacterium]
MKQTTILLSILAMVSCTTRQPSGNTDQKASEMQAAFDSITTAYFKEGLELRPLEATMFGIPGYNDKFVNPLSDPSRAQLREYYEKYRNEINRYPDQELTAEQANSRKIILWQAEVNLERLTFREDLLPIDQTWSLNHTIGEWAAGKSAQPFNTVQDYRNWLKRLDGYLEWMQMAEDKMKEGISEGYVLPASLIRKIPSTLEPFASTDPEKNLFFEPIRNFPDSFTEEEKTSLTESYTEMITERIIPAYRSLIDFISTTYLEAGRSTSGIDGIPHGEAYYRLMIREQTSTDLTAEEIYQTGLSEVDRIRKEMELVKKEVGFEGDLSAFFKYVKQDPALTPYTEPEQVIGHFKAIYERIKPRVDLLFDQQPTIGFEIRRTPAFAEKTTGAHYNPGSEDGSRPGVFYVSVPDASAYNIMSDETLFLHEAVPGHHFQMALTQENQDIPMFRRILWMNAYGEGWALYTESLGKELGLYIDPYQYFGNLTDEMHRAIRLVVDVGLHAKGWTREQAIQYSLENEPYSERTIVSEIERYMAFPGQALGYKIGQMRILALRARAEQTLSDRFDIREFHNTVLHTGCVPLELLDEIVNRWIIESDK